MNSEIAEAAARALLTGTRRSRLTQRTDMYDPDYPRTTVDPQYYPQYGPEVTARAVVLLESIRILAKQFGFVLSGWDDGTVNAWHPDNPYVALASLRVVRGSE